MSEGNPQSQDTPKDPQSGGTDLGTELRELGQQIEQAMRAAFESERAQTIRKDFSAGMREITAQLQNAMQAVQSNPRMQELSERGQQALNQAQENPQLKEFQEALARGVAQMNQQIAAFAERTRQGGTTGSTPAQNVPIDHEPATGETTRLDPDKE